MKRGFVYLTVVMDWRSRRVLSHRVSITMDTIFCLDALEEAIDKYWGVLDEKVGNLDEYQYMLYVELKEYISESHCRNIGEQKHAC
jgi:hypothetical protein